MRELVTFTLDGVKMSLRPTFEAYGAIEARFGNLRQVYTTVVTGYATLALLAGIIKIGSDEAGEAFHEDAIQQRLYGNGAFHEDTVLPISDYLAALGWTPEQRKKIAADAAKPTRATRSR